MMRVTFESGTRSFDVLVEVDDDELEADILERYAAFIAAVGR